MEDYIPTDDEKTLSPRKKRAERNFLDSWLLLRHSPERAQVAEDEGAGNKKLIFEKWWSRVFTNTVERPQLPVSVKENQNTDEITVELHPAGETDNELKESKSVNQEVPEKKPRLPSQPNGPPPERLGTIMNRYERIPLQTDLSKEALHRRQEVKKRKELAKLERRLKKSETQQQTISQEQEVFEQKVKVELQTPVEPAAPETADSSAQTSPERPLGEELTINGLENTPFIRQEVEKLKEWSASPETVRPETVLQEVEVAVEHDIPLESIYERRHEIKEEPPFTSGAGQGQAVVSPSLTGVSASIKPEIEARNAGSAPLSSAMQKAAQIQNDPLYKQAVTRGFWAAIILLATITAIAILR